MSYGGALIWSALARNLREHFPEREVVFVRERSPRQRLGLLPDHAEEIYRHNDDISAVLVPRQYKRMKAHFPPDRFIVVDQRDDRYHYWTGSNSRRIFYKDGLHAIEYACRAAGIAKPTLRPHLVLSDDEEAQADRILVQAGLKGKRLLCFEPSISSSVGVNKRWAADNWRVLVQELKRVADEQSLTLVQIGAPAEPLEAEVLSLSGKLSFRQSLRVLEQAEVLVTYAGALVHLMKAAGGRSVVIGSAWEPRALLHYPEDVYLQTDIACKHCGLTVPCPYGLPCMEKISVGEVLQGVRTLLGKPRS